MKGRFPLGISWNFVPEARDLWPQLAALPADFWVLAAEPLAAYGGPVSKLRRDLIGRGSVALRLRAWTAGPAPLDAIFQTELQNIFGANKPYLWIWDEERIGSKQTPEVKPESSALTAFGVPAYMLRQNRVESVDTSGELPIAIRVQASAKIALELQAATELLEGRDPEISFHQSRLIALEPDAAASGFDIGVLEALYLPRSEAFWSWLTSHSVSGAITFVEWNGRPQSWPSARALLRALQARRPS